jgi:hypothetical protein
MFNSTCKRNFESVYFFLNNPVQYKVKGKGKVRSQVLTAASMKMAVLWVVAPCSLVEVYRRFSGACCLHH